MAQNEEQLTIYVGDRLRVLETSDSGWWGAQLIGNNKRGLVPNNYIEKEKPSAETSSKLSGGSSSVPGSSHSSGNSLAPPMASRASGSATLPRRPPKGSTSTITKSESIDSGKSSGGIAKMLSGFEQAASAAAASSSLPSSVPRSSGTLPSLRREKEEEKSPVPNPIYGRGPGVKAKSKTLDLRSGTAPPEVTGGGGGGGASGFSAIKAKLEGKSPSSAPTTPLMKRKAPAPKEPSVTTASASSAAATSPPPISIGAFKAKLEASATSAAPFSEPVKRKAFGGGGDAGKAGNRSEAKPGSIADSPIFKKRQKEADGNAGASAAPPPPSTKPSKQPPKQPPKAKIRLIRLGEYERVKFVVSRFDGKFCTTITTPIRILL